MKRLDISESNESLHSKKAVNKQPKNLAEVNRDLRLKSPAGQKAALHELAKGQPKPVTEPAARLSSPVKQQPRAKLNVSALIAALSNIRSQVGSLPATVLSDVKSGDRKMAAICKELLAIQQSLERVK